MKRRLLFVGALLTLCFVAAALVPAVDDKPPPVVKHGRGLVLPKPEKLAELHKESLAKHKDRLRALRRIVTPSNYDSRSLGIVPPVRDQGACGSCWDFSGTGTIGIAYCKAGVWKADDAHALSEQYTMDCGQNGGCQGDDATSVFAWAKTTGLPLAADYAPYSASSNACALKPNTKMYKIADWGYCDGSGGSGITPVQDIKNAILTYGCASVCVAASGGDWDSYSGGINKGSGSTSIDHQVIAVGWQDDSTLPGGGYWIIRNSWGTSWGENGYMRLCYGADAVGTEAMFCLVNAVNVMTVTVPNVAGQAGQPVSFSPAITGGQSPYTMNWTYGDGATGASPTHTYTTTGAYTAAVTATDVLGATAQASATATIGATPPPPVGNTITITSALPPGTYQIVQTEAGAVILPADLAERLRAILAPKPMKDGLEKRKMLGENP